MGKFNDQNFLQIAPGQIDREDTLTDFSLDPVPPALEQSIREIGITHPVTLAPRGDRYRVICGHRRVHIAAKLGFEKVPATVQEPDLDEGTMLTANLAENRPLRRYSDIEKGLILDKLSRAGIEESRIIQKYMPMVELERSKKLFEDFRAAAGLEPPLRDLLHKARVPIRVCAPLFQWPPESRTAAARVFSVLRPGINKWRGLLELIDETARLEDREPADILQLEEVVSLLSRTDLPPHEKYDQVFSALFRRRYPMLAELKRKAALLLDRLELDPQTRIRIQDSFESEEVRIELRFSDREALIAQVEKLSRAAGSDAMRELIRLLKHPH